MKTVKSIMLALGLATVSVSTLAAAPGKDVRFVGDTQFSGFCKAVVMDDVRVLRANLSRNVGRIGASQREVLRLVTADNGLTCNGETLIDFSMQRGAGDVYEYLTSRS